MQRAFDIGAWIISLWFGCGLVPLAPGTAGTLGALPLYLVLRPFGWWSTAVTTIVLTLLAVAASSRVARLHGAKDPQFVCVDEVTGVLITWLGAPFTWKATLAGFVLFRVFDSWKPFPARRAEALPFGWGIVFDDVFAGLWGAAVLGAVHRMGWV